MHLLHLFCLFGWVFLAQRQLVSDHNIQQNLLLGYLDPGLCLSKLLGVICCIHESSAVIIFFGDCGSCMFFVTVKHYEAFTPNFFSAFGAMS